MNRLILYIGLMCCVSLNIYGQTLNGKQQVQQHAQQNAKQQVQSGTQLNAKLNAQLNALLKEDVLRTSEVGISVYNLTAGKKVFAYQDAKLYRPASIEKIITSVTALAELGADYTFDTRLSMTGKIENDTLKGKLMVSGALDPLFMEEHLDSLVSSLSQRGVRHITDSLIADVSLKDSVYWGPGWSWDDTPYSFQPYLSPLMLNKGCVTVYVSPTQRDSLPNVVCRPKSTYYTVLNKAQSYQPQAGKLKVTRNWLHNGNQLMVAGNVETTQKKEVNVYRSEEFFMQVLMEKLKKQGIEVSGYRYKYQDNSHTDSLHTDSLQTLAVVHRPIREVLKEALKESDNLCAEAMFYHLAALRAWGKPVSAEDGTEAIQAFITQKLGLNPDLYNIVDGSGVSLYNYVSPRLMMEYLKYAYYHREVFLPFYEALPIAGVDGTLKHRMTKTKGRGNVHAKTGSVKGVSSLAGYVRAGNGDMMAFVIINQNVLKLSRARAFQDKLCRILSQTP